jgi:plasmid stability protein
MQRMAVLTIRNVPATLHAKLKASAAANGRSLNNEVIACLKSIFEPQPLNVEAFLARVRRLHERANFRIESEEELNRLKRTGRHE